VWTPKARSFLMDTIVRGKPIPKIFIRQITNPKTRRTVREVVDGQQRLRTILNFLQDGFKISPSHNKEHGGKLFSQLPEDTQKSILEYEISVDTLLDVDDQDVLDIFARINSYAVTLSPQELLHARFYGPFRQTVYQLALEYLNFWRDNRIFSDKKILRMAEAELTSELLIAMSDGIQSKKSIRLFYEKYDEKYPSQETYAKRFRETMDVIGGIMAGSLPTSNFRRNHLFYTLFCSVYHMLHVIPELTAERKAFGAKDYPKLRVALDTIDQIFVKAEQKQEIIMSETDEDDAEIGGEGDNDAALQEALSPEEFAFLTASRRATTDASVRVFRTKHVCELMMAALQQ